MQNWTQTHLLLSYFLLELLHHWKVECVSEPRIPIFFSFGPISIQPNLFNYKSIDSFMSFSISVCNDNVRRSRGSICNPILPFNK
jgi:hypothetical protein